MPSSTFLIEANLQQTTPGGTFSRRLREGPIPESECCDANAHVWVLGEATTNVGYDLVVTDTATGVERVYSNPAGQISPAVADVEAFACSD